MCLFPLPHRVLWSAGQAVEWSGCDSPMLKSSMLRTGREQLQKFVEKTLEDMIESEERQLGRFSSLRLFARVDVGIREVSPGTFSYFVNEVERVWGTNLFTAWSIPANMAMFGDVTSFWTHFVRYGQVPRMRWLK